MIIPVHEQVAVDMQNVIKFIISCMRGLYGMLLSKNTEAAAIYSEEGRESLALRDSIR